MLWLLYGDERWLPASGPLAGHGGANGELERHEMDENCRIITYKLIICLFVKIIYNKS